jgi:hypothetical protein
MYCSDILKTKSADATSIDYNNKIADEASAN